MKGDLEKLVEKRKAQAIKRNIIEKVQKVAEEFGAYQALAGLEGYASGTKHARVFNREGLKVTFIEELHPGVFDRDDDWYSYEFKIDYKNRCVFEDYSRDTKRYIPGAWEKKLDRFYFKAIGKLVGDEKRKHDAEELKAKKDAENRLREDFGL